MYCEESRSHVQTLDMQVYIHVLVTNPDVGVCRDAEAGDVNSLDLAYTARRALAVTETIHDTPFKTQMRVT